MGGIPRRRCFATADFHGCEFAVLRATGQGRVGATGIVVHETERTFRVVTPEDKLLVLPKDGAEFGKRVALCVKHPIAAVDISKGCDDDNVKRLLLADGLRDCSPWATRVRK